VITTATPIATKTPWQVFETGVLKILLVAALLVGQHYYDRFEYGQGANPVTPGVLPGPGPVPAPKPSTIGNLRVLMLYESSANQSAAQLAVLNSTKVRTYLNTHCLADGGYPAWRSWDKDVDASKDTAGWQTALTAAKADPKPIPKFLIFAGTSLVDSVPLPATEADALTLLQTYGGK